MGGLLGLCSAIDALNTQVARAAKWLVLASILISAVNAVMRKLFSLSSNAYLEAQWYLFSAVFLLTAAYTLLRGEHVKIDLIYAHLRRRTQVMVEILGTLFFLLPFSIVTIYLSLPVALAKFASGEVSINNEGLPLWPAWILIPIGFSLLALQGLSEVVKRAAFLAGAAPDPGHRHEPHQA
jgi:TRAP-type mannitol/chloroaromatic compound transport system permease small subunit